MIASVWALAVEHVLAFALGLGVGFVLSNRFRIVKRNGAPSRDELRERVEPYERTDAFADDPPR